MSHRLFAPMLSLYAVVIHFPLVVTHHLAALSCAEINSLDSVALHRALVSKSPALYREPTPLQSDWPSVYRAMDLYS
eukprot:1962191-Karenia_brevis.AAC.1